MPCSFLSVCVLLITSWYTRYELGLRLTIFYAGVTINQAASPILAYLVMLMNGLGGLVGWQWIFVIFGKSHDLSSWWFSTDRDMFG
jgi:MFS family permease